jgi:hypothetical protein
MQRTCSVEGCERPFHARNYCYRHYRRLLEHGDAREDIPIVAQGNCRIFAPPEPMPCPIDGIDRETMAMVACATEYSNAAHMAAWWAADARIQAANAAWDTLELAAD